VSFKRGSAEDTLVWKVGGAFPPNIRFYISRYTATDRAIEIRSPAGARIFPLASVSRPALGPTQPPVQWVPGVLSLGVKRGRGVTLTPHHHLVSRSRMSRSYTFSPLKRLHGV
jgi:hypothetical protein